MRPTLLLIPLFIFLSICGLTSCIEDGFDTSPSSQPAFSTDTLDLGLTFTDQPTATHRFTVRNRHDRQLNISRIALSGDGARYFRINVDGFSGREFSDIEIRPGDSIFVFVEATLPPNSTPQLTDIFGAIDFTTNGVTRSVTLRASGLDVIRHRALTITDDTVWDAEYPYQIFDSLIVAPGATLTLRPGATLHFHDKASLTVRGTLISEGTPEAPVTMRGDRIDNVVGNISFDIMASQWDGLTFAPGSRSNRLSHTTVCNTVDGILADSLSQVTFLNCRLRNSASYPLVGRYADLTLLGTEVAEGAEGLLGIIGGTLVANHCTFANYYLFAALRGPAVQLYHLNADASVSDDTPYLRADISNTIVYGLGTDLNVSDFADTEVYWRRCLFKETGEDDDHFIATIWDTDPEYAT
ncbi:MAG: hypothetical protein K2H87_07295, partial [Duncaniella sp.]|nr:hypothetical protein [Duncaniella sp.]